jgi:hypothetical protein
MNIYLITQNVNNNYDTYDSAVVAAATEQEAKEVNPGWNGPRWWEDENRCSYSSWASHPDQVEAELIGTTDHAPGVILSSFNAG